VALVCMEYVAEVITKGVAGISARAARPTALARSFRCCEGEQTKTARGGAWTPVHVSNILKRAEAAP
jgi:hypothetical protein